MNPKTKAALLFGLVLIWASAVAAHHASLTAAKDHFALAQAQAASNQHVVEGKVVRVSDGDTIRAGLCEAARQVHLFIYAEIMLARQILIA